MTTVQIKARTKGVAVHAPITAILPYVAICLAGALLVFGAAIWLIVDQRSVGHALIASGAVIATFSGMDLVRRVSRLN